MPSHKPGSGRVGEAVGGTVAGLVFAGFGLFWTVMAFQITKGAPFPLVHAVFPLFGLIFVAIGIGIAVNSMWSAGSVSRYGVIDPTTLRPRVSNEPASPAIKPRSLVHCDCGEPRRVGGRFCSRCGKRADEITS